MLSFPPFRIDLESERIWKLDEELHLRRKPFAILRHLVRNPQRLVPHGEIVEAVWGKIAMSESLLRTHVHDLRLVLGGGIVETVAGRGYRFVADVRHADPEPRSGAITGAAAEPCSRAIVGRESEVNALGNALRGVKEQRRAAVFVSGEAGVGKTTLVDFFLQRAASQSALLVGRGVCVEQYGSGQAYLPVLDAISSLCRGRGGERVIELLARHAPTWLAQLPGLLRSDRLEDVQRRAAGATQGRTLRELAEALETISAETPVVVVFEDLQWTDPSTAELLAILCTRREPARLLVVGTHRPAEVTRGHPLTKVLGELLAHRQAAAIALDGFDAETLEAYLAERFPAHRFPRPLVGALQRATGGNPLFLTMLLDDLEGLGVIRRGDAGWELAISVEEVAARRPDGVTRLIDTQIDRLTAAEQRVLEAASVAGTSFTAGMVAHALETVADDVDSCCESLTGERGLLQFVGTETWPDGTVQSRYGFRHALIQHTARARSTSAKIRAWHRKVAERLEAGYAGHEGEVAAELAVHFDRAQQQAKAAPYFATAGESAARRYGIAEAVAHFERAIALLPAMPQGSERDAVDLRASHSLAGCLLQLEGGDAALPLLQRAGELAVRLGDHVRFAQVIVDLQLCLLVRGDLREAVESAPGLGRLLDQVPDPALRTRATQAEAIAAMLLARFEEVKRLFGVLGLLPENEGIVGVPTQLAVGALANGAFVAWLVGHPDVAVRLARWAYQAAEAAGDPFQRAFVMVDWARLHLWRREPAEAEDLARRALALADESSFSVLKNRAQMLLKSAEIEREAAPTRERVDTWLREWWGAGGVGRTIDSALMAAMSLRVGRPDRALEEIDAGLSFVERTGERIVEPELHRLRGEILKSRDFAEAERSIRKAVAVAREQSSLALELRAMVSLHALSTGAERETARVDLARLVSKFDEGLDTPDLVEARAVVGR
jgi:DNA-binding winged helix-turn-helix (wHTH) protein/tetratricopeptide (TPR) repeat protein